MKNEQVTEAIQKLSQPWQIEIANQLREIIFAAIPDVVERLQYGKPHYLKGKQYAAVVGPAKGWVSLTIFNAQALVTPDKLFESSENGDRKTIKISEGQAVDYPLLQSLIAQAASTL